MAGSSPLAAIEDAALLIGRLDARISASPLREAWQVRAALQAGMALTGIDGMPTRAVDVAGAMCGAKPLSVDAMIPAASALAWWRMSLARTKLSPTVERLIGRRTSGAQSAREAQEDWDQEDRTPKEARGLPIEDLDEWARREGERAMRAVGREAGDGGGLRAVARAVREALKEGVDAGFGLRAYEMAKTIGAQALAHAEGQEGMDGDERDARVARMRAAVAALELRPPSRLGAVHAMVPDMLRELGMTAMRLSCLTGATKRIGWEGRLDDRALKGFAATLAREARGGLALLDALEACVARWASSETTRSDARSRLPDVLHALLVLPAVDVDWLVQAGDMDQRVAQKFTRRLADAGLISEWADRTVERDGRRDAEVRLWMAAGLDEDYDRALRRRGVWTRAGGGPAMEGGPLMERAADVDLATPMAEVFARFDREMVDIDREFGRLTRRPERATGTLRRRG